ncbi:MAG: hypothetical protein L3J26_12360 [Candidatus Polarisedimenticolaceae bacterium]|nr:hypothetical protein [Candidatus Polarisedimenticolaceae bacterium]
MANKNMAGFIAALHEGADLLERLNKTYPNLADSFSQEAVIEFRRAPITLQNTQEQQTKTNTSKQAFTEESTNNQGDQKLVTTARELLAIHSFEDVLDLLQAEHGITLDLTQLVNLVGSSAYSVALRREAQEFQSNAISLPQIVQLWKDFGRPPIGDAEWTASSVSRILE